MSSMKAYGGSSLFSMAAAKTYTKDRSKFKGSGTHNNMAYSYDVLKAPTVQLVHGNRTHNIVFDFAKVNVRVVLPAPLPPFNDDVPMEGRGKISISAGVLRVTSLSVSTASPNPMHQLVVGVINAQVVPMIQARIQAIPLPQLDKLFNNKLSAKASSGTVISGPAMELTAVVTGKSSLAPADKPSSADLNSLTGGNATDARAVAVLSADALNHIIKKNAPALSHKFEQKKSKVGFGAGIKGTIKASTPVLAIANAKGTAKTTVTFSGLKGGIRVPIKGWTWVSLPSPATSVAITNSLSTSGGKARVKLTGVSSLKVDLNWPKVLKPVEAMVKGLLNGILSLFKGKISAAVKKVDIPAIDLPNKLPGTTFPATLSFENLGYYKKSLKAKVRVRG